MKRKLFSILTLALLVCSGAWAQSAADTYLDLEWTDAANHDVSYTIDQAGWSKNTPAYAWDATTKTLVVNAYNAYSSVSKQKWITVNGSGSTSVSGGWAASVPFKGSSYWGTSTSASTVNTSRATSFTIKGITKVSVYGGTDNTARQVVLTVKNGDTSVGSATTNAEKNGTDIISVNNLSSSITYTITVTGNNSGNGRFFEIAFIGQAATETFTVTFNAGTNGSCATSSLTEASPGAGVTLPSVTANSGYAFDGWYTAATGGTKVGNAGATYKPTDNVTVYAQYSALAAPTISVDASASTVVKNATVTLTATVSGSPAPTIQWYSNTTASTTGGTAIEGATSATYSPSTGTSGTYYYYAVATNSEGNATSDVQTITVLPSNKCVLNQVVFSNSFDAFITAPVAESGTPGEEGYVAAANGTIKAYYMAGTSAPTINSVNMSADATYVVNGTTLTVTAEDGTTTADYDITLEAVTPYAGVGKYTFDGTEDWVKTGYTFSTASGKEGWLFSKNDTDWSRETPGKNRVYFFLAPSTTVSFENGGTARDIKVYKNGTQLSTPTSSGSCEIAGDTDAAYMIAIVSNQTNGDGALKSITVVKNFDVNVGAKGYATFVNSNYALDFTGKSIKAYTISSTDGQKLTLTNKNKIAKGEPVLLYSATESDSQTIPAIAESEATADDANKLVAGTGAAITWTDTDKFYILYTGGENPGFYAANNSVVAVGKAYLDLSGLPTSARSFSFDLSDGEATGIAEIEAMKNVGNEKFYNLSGQRVAQPTKGLYIVGGRKVMVK